MGIQGSIRAIAGAIALVGISAQANATLLQTWVLLEDESGRWESATDPAAIPTGPVSTDLTSGNGLSVGRASGDLATGEFKAFAEGQDPFQFVEVFQNGIPVDLPTSGGSANAVVNFGDTLNILGDISGIQTLTLLASIEGVLTGSQFEPDVNDRGYTSRGTFSLTASSGLSGSSLAHEWLNHSREEFCSLGAICHLDTVGAFAEAVSLTAAIDDAHRTISFNGFLATTAFWGTILDVGSTARLSVLLPEGLAFESESKLFLTGRTPPSVPVPEPGSVGLLSLGLVILVARRAGRRRPAP